MTIDWNWPIEFLDGTPAWVEPLADSDGDSRVVYSHEQAFGVAMARGKHGCYSKLVEPNDAFIRNVAIPEIRFENMPSIKASSGMFVRQGRELRLTRTIGPNEVEVSTYSWPTLKPLYGSPNIITLNRKQAEAAAMEENDVFGLF